jgi:hypothetical protein
MTKNHAEQRHLVIGYGLVLLGALGFSAKAIIVTPTYNTTFKSTPLA